MKAIHYRQYGSPDVLAVADVETPTPRDNEVRVKIHAASINSWDWDMIRGKPWIVRMWGLFKPRFVVPGADIAGVIDSVGRAVTKFSPGDEVFGDLSASGWGGFSEFKCVHENVLAPKPSSISFEQAAALPQAGLMALQGLYDDGDIKSGESVLINGGGGGVGTFAIQLAKLRNAQVTAVDSHGKLDLMRSLGADHVLDYAIHDFTSTGKRYDLIIDVVANRPLSHYKRALGPRGRFLMIGGSMNAILQAMLFSKWISRGDDRKLGMLAYATNRGLSVLAELCEKGKLNPVIDRIVSLDETAEAFRYFATGDVKGKIVIRI